ncbi:hypothetical protein L7F22_040675 [Adiantum nelumboides]|nr:hypothetical protein [Adiantum nelumboides]
MRLDVTRLVAGTKLRGELEDCLTLLMDEIQKCSRRVILFIDEIHIVMGTGGTAIDAADLLKPALARGELQCMGATTRKEYRKYIEKDPALERRFQVVDVPAASVDETIRILRGLCSKYEDHHKVYYSDEALVAAARLSNRYITDRFLPDKAINLIDEAGSYVRIQNAGNSDLLCPSEAAIEVTADHVKHIIASWIGIPMEKMSCAESKMLHGLEAELHRRIIGQDQAMSMVSRAVRRARIGLQDPSRPIASFIFCGPTGVGKSQIAKAMARVYFGSEEAMVRLDMSEYMEKHSVSRLIGSPPGYVGYDESGQLTEAVRRRPFTILLLDEIEKAHPDVFNLMLQILEDGRLTDSKGTVVDFKNTLIIMTSNVGSSALAEGRLGMKTIGFHSKAALNTPNSSTSQTFSLVEAELKQCFRPEFLNRLDEIVIFNLLTQEHVRRIAYLMIEDVVERLRENMSIKVQVSDRLRDKIVRDGFCPTYGARPLRRSITRFLEDGVAEHILAGRLKMGDSAILDLNMNVPNNLAANTSSSHGVLDCQDINQAPRTVYD